MDLNYYNYFSIGVFGTGVGLCLFRLIRKLRCKKCFCVCRPKTIVITGATSGLGKACAYEFAKRNCKLILGCRNVSLGQKIADDINKLQPIARVIPLDLSSLDSINSFCDILSNDSIDVLINNAGVMAGHFRMVQCTKTEEDMTVNYLGHFLLTNLLIRSLIPDNYDSGDSGDDSRRIIFISSSLCKRGKLDINSLDLTKCAYSPMQAYANSKLALCLFSRDLHRRLHPKCDDECSINVITMFTGGMVNTALNRHILSGYNIFLQPILKLIFWLFLKDPIDACQSIVHCALSKDLNRSSGELFANFKPIPWPERVKESMKLCPDLWSKSCELVRL